LTLLHIITKDSNKRAGYYDKVTIDFFSENIGQRLRTGINEWADSRNIYQECPNESSRKQVWTGYYDRVTDYFFNENAGVEYEKQVVRKQLISHRNNWNL